MRNGVMSIVALSFFLSGCQESPDTNSAVASANHQASSMVATYSAAEFFETTTFATPQATPYAFASNNVDLLIGSDQSGVFNAYRLNTSTGEQQQLTFSQGSPISPISWFPEDGRFLFSQDGSGDELDHIYVQTPEGESRDLTPGEQVKAFMLGWATGGDAFYIATNERDSSAFDVYRYNADDYQRALVYENTDAYSIGDISPDGRWLALIQEINNANNELVLLDLSSAVTDPVVIKGLQGDVNHRVFSFSPDNSTLVYGTDAHGDFVQAWTYEFSTGKTAILVDAPWDVSYSFYSPSGRYRVTGINADASTQVSIVDNESGEALDLDNLPPGDLRALRFSRDESTLAFGLNADISPTDLYTLSLKDLTVKRLTDSLSPSIERDALVQSEVVRFASYDGLQVPGILYKPKNASAANPVPALVWVHGGPGGQSRKGYSATLQHLVNHGYAIYAINNRGSSGYGKTFNHLDDKRHGDADLGDVVASRDFLASYDWIDGEHIGIIGGSYGGFMVAAALAFEPEVFDVGINIFGVTNWVRTLKSIPPWWGSFRDSLYAEMGDPATDETRLRAISPVFHATNIVKPLLVIQGANDPRVLQVESDELVANVRANNVPVEYVLFDDEGHGFAKRENRITASEAYLAFLDEYL